MPEIIKIDPENPEQTLTDRVVEILKAGGVIAYPTETFYGLGAHAGIRDAVERIFLIKQRPLPIPSLLSWAMKKKSATSLRRLRPLPGD